MVAPGKRGYQWVKWIVALEVNDTVKWLQPSLPLQPSIEKQGPSTNGLLPAHPEPACPEDGIEGALATPAPLSY
ncbi:MAG: hypothetical protein O6914_08535 [Chloroflexi bacterium]|nr:hypothetical protein [Chloroflexota bacterium]